MHSRGTRHLRASQAVALRLRALSLGAAATQQRLLVAASAGGRSVASWLPSFWHVSKRSVRQKASPPPCSIKATSYWPA